jgi:hypothetical protein
MENFNLGSQDFNENDIEDEVYTDLHDNHLLPIGCRSIDDWAECDIYELLGRE